MLHTLLIQVHTAHSSSPHSIMKHLPSYHTAINSMALVVSNNWNGLMNWCTGLTFKPSCPYHMTSSQPMCQLGHMFEAGCQIAGCCEIRRSCQTAATIKQQPCGHVSTHQILKGRINVVHRQYRQQCQPISSNPILSNPISSNKNDICPISSKAQ